MANREIASADQDDNVGSGQDESTGSYLQRIIDAGNTNILKDTPTSDICKEVILTLLQCAARLYEGVVSKQGAVDLIQDKHTRALLSLGIQDAICQAVHQRCVRSIQSDQSVAKNIRKYFPQVDLLSTLRENRTQQLSCRVLVFDHISSLCRLYSTQLQNKFDGPGMSEQFMFYNYITLSKNFDRCEKSWLIALLPDLFQWEDHVPSSGTGTLVPRIDMVLQLDALTTSDSPHDKAPITFKTEFRGACDRQLKDGQLLTDASKHGLDLPETPAAEFSNCLELPSENSYHRLGMLEPTKMKRRYVPGTFLTSIAEETAEQLKVEEEFAERSEVGMRHEMEIGMRRASSCP
ncbi:hypothetical protein BKA61DRAFT_680567 [Leptodontidium sp. MPI-SDFR-AT-0119]|nr:hypothetical protein BKA61DRAFT_680567 [Leptodontidium sp. MPI-SDFR-AT-0119]